MGKRVTVCTSRAAALNMIYEDLEDAGIDEDQDIKDALHDIEASEMSIAQLETVWKLTFHILYVLKDKWSTP